MFPFLGFTGPSGLYLKENWQEREEDMRQGSPSQESNIEKVTCVTFHHFRERSSSDICLLFQSCLSFIAKI